MTKDSKSGSPAGEQSPPSEPRRPKRGAFPTPKSELEKAKVYVPEVSDFDDGPEEKPDPPTPAEGEEDG
jgi:hypothetical protein